MSEMPICARCGLSHWNFRPCSEGKRFVQRNYGMVKRASAYPSMYGGQRRETDYQRQQFRARPKVSYDEEPPEAA